MSKPLVVELWPIAKIVPYEKNAKLHPEEQIETLAKSIKELGWDQPIVVDSKGVVIKGHGRRLAAIKLGLEKVPVVIRDDLTDDQVRAARLADNKVSSTAYDTELLQLEIADLVGLEDFDMGILGYNEKELEFLTADLTEINDSMFSRDLSRDVERSISASEEKLKEVGGARVPITKVFGFKQLPASVEKDVFQMMAEIEAATGLEGSDAFAVFVRALVSDSRFNAILEGLSE